MKKILKIFAALLLIVVVGIALILILPNKSIDEIKEIQSALIDLGYYDTLENEFGEYSDLYVETLENQHNYKESLESNLNRSTKRTSLSYELLNRMNYIEERIEAKNVTTETALELKNLTLEIIMGIKGFVLLTDKDFFTNSDVELISGTINDLRGKVKDHNAITGKYFVEKE